MAADPTVAFGTVGYGDVMSYIYRMDIPVGVKERVGQRLMAESKSKYLSVTFDRINHLSRLKDNWDGEGASHILQEVLDNILLNLKMQVPLQQMHSFPSQLQVELIL